jgi:hypothetical protein
MLGKIRKDAVSFIFISSVYKAYEKPLSSIIGFAVACIARRIPRSERIELIHDESEQLHEQRSRQQLQQYFFIIQQQLLPLIGYEQQFIPYVFIQDVEQLLPLIPVINDFLKKQRCTRSVQ